jgi:hypothetical protein
MAEKNDIKKALGEILGHELTEDELQAIELYQKVAAWEQTNVPGTGFITKVSNIIFLPKTCERRHLLDVSSTTRTASNGKSKFLVSNFICPKLGGFDHPINVVATPLHPKPVFLTLQHFMVKTNPGDLFGIDVEIEVSTWDANGAPAPDVRFDWRCRVAFVEPGPL